MKNPIEKAPLDTIKEIGGADTLKEQPFDTLKEAGGGDTIKEQPFDTLKETGGGDTLKEQPFDTLKEIGGGDTLKEIGGGDTLKEQPFDTLKEQPFDTLKEFGEGTGVGDTLVEGIPQNPGGGVVQPAFQTRAGGVAGAQNFKPLVQDTIKELSTDHTFKELVNDTTIKEIIHDQTIKELVKEIPKEVAWEGTGVADSLVESIPDWGSVINPAINTGVVNPAAGALTPFVLATPHQASQGAVAQQLLAAQALQGRLGF